MLRSMYAGVSGLRTHQQMMDVTGNNIANVSTTGFKSSATVFQDTLSQTLAGASAPTGDGTVPPFGGTNPAQIGLGVRLGGISTNLAQGSSQLTGRATDIAVQGDGYFVIQTGNEALYTRAGSFSLDARGQLTTPAGGLVLGIDDEPITVPPNGEYESFTIAPDGKVNGVKSDGTGIELLGQIKLATFANPAGLAKVGGSLLRATVNSGPVIEGATAGVPGADGRGLLAVGVLEMSNVDLAQEFTNLIVAQRGFQANSRIITASDEVLQELVNLKR
ncbi:MAG: flagellar hook-basal body complex protein [Actinomycetota bacterium]|nr:flagellar hook-basal body complex protein [Actinomycetota bacterium]